jgi:hypothetical protein
VNTGERLQTGRHIHGVQVVARSNRADPTITCHQCAPTAQLSLETAAVTT